MHTTHFKNHLGKNRPSPKNEQDYINAYLELNPKAKKPDGYDVAAIITVNGEKVHGLVKEEINRGHDKNYHIVKDVIPDSVLKEAMKQKNT